MSAKITFHCKIAFEFPKRLSSGDRMRIARLVEACNYLDEHRGATTDRHLSADAIDAIVTLSNVVRRARACGGGEP